MHDGPSKRLFHGATTNVSAVADAVVVNAEKVSPALHVCSHGLYLKEVNVDLALDFVAGDDTIEVCASDL